jgi:hypothetical protein
MHDFLWSVYPRGRDTLLKGLEVLLWNREVGRSRPLHHSSLQECSSAPSLEKRVKPLEEIYLSNEPQP